MAARDQAGTPHKGPGNRVVALIPGWVTPNQLTLLRMVLSLAILAGALLNWNLGLLILMGIAAGVSDLLDGAVARQRGLESRLGALLDPLGDKIFALALAVLLLCRGWVPLWLLLLMLLTEVHTLVIPTLVLAGRRRRGQKLRPLPKVRPNRWGKLKTAWLAAAMGLVAIGAWFGSEMVMDFARYNLWVALGLGLVAEYYYFSAWRAGEFG